jgi:phenylalanyl-tRNA synthetase beta chain
MRTTALPSMLEVLARNYNFNNTNVKLFEVATVYIPTTPDKLPNENKVIVLGMYGDCDFYTAKGVCENILALAQIKNYTVTACSDNVSYHPGRCAKITVGDKCIGVFGEIHPLTLKNYDVNTPVYAAELDFDEIFALMDPNKIYTPLPKYPATTRDFSFVCEESLEVGAVFAEVKKAGGKLVEDVSLFDIYRGHQIGENKKSVSIRVTLRASDRTLTVEEAEKCAAKILKAMEAQLGITLRG